MGYNKFIEEQKWLKWKEAEERQLRKLGVDETIIKRLHEYDKEQFNKERRYRQKQVAWSSYIDWYSAQFLELPVKDVDSFLNAIDNDQLLSVLLNVDKITLQIVVAKIMRYTSKEIAEQIGITCNAVDLRIFKFKQKIKKFFK